jgi:hypothetical protein
MAFFASTDRFTGGGYDPQAWNSFGNKARRRYFIFIVKTEQEGEQLARSVRRTTGIGMPLPACCDGERMMSPRVGYAVIEAIPSMKVGLYYNFCRLTGLI